MYPTGQLEEGQQASVKLRQKLYEMIKHEIITCRLPPGAQLSEALIADKYQVSKTPVREALTSLSQNHLVEYRPNKGFNVTAITLKDIQEIFEARLFFECKLLELAAKHITTQELRELEECQVVSYDGDDPESLNATIEKNTEFHMRIAYASRNGRLIWHYQLLLDEAQRLIYLDLKNHNVTHIWPRSHARFVDAIRRKDVTSGIQAIEETMENGRKRILGL